MEFHKDEVASGDIYFSSKITNLEKITKNTRFLPFFFRNELQKIKNSKIYFYIDFFT